MLFKGMAILAGFAMSVSFAACDDDDNQPDNGSTDSDKVTTVVVDYRVDMGQAYRDYFDINVEYTDQNGENKTTVITAPWAVNYQTDISKAADRYICRVVAKPKENHPEITEGKEYNISLDIHTSVLGKNAKGEYNEKYGVRSSSEGEDYLSARQLVSYLKRDRNIHDFFYDTVK